MKKYLTGIIALLLVATSAAVAYELSGIKWVEVKAKGNAYAGVAENYAILVVLGEDQWNSWAKIKIRYTKDIDSVESACFTYHKIKGEVTPYLVLEVDTDGDCIADTWVVQWPKKAEKYKIDYFSDDWQVVSRISEYDMRGEHLTLEQVRDTIDGELKSVKVAVGFWESNKEHAYAIFSVKVNGIEILQE
ncbi:MAG: hypothetical protein DRO09_03395 [Thermoprotei archaeon]|nr:MAG: hypothetical protein DRO09_03395 [Thermoprotei archaeon]